MGVNEKHRAELLDLLEAVISYQGKKKIQLGSARYLFTNGFASWLIWLTSCLDKLKL